MTYFWMYLKGTIWLLLFILLCYECGDLFCRKDKSGPYKIMYGYLGISLVSAIMALPIRLTNGEWALYRFLMYVWLTILLVAIVWKRIQHPVKITREDVIRFFKNYGIFIILTAVAALFAELQFQQFWCGNHSDDGFYISQLTSFTMAPHPFEIQPSSGIRSSFAIDSYSINTLTMEQAFWCEMLQIYTTLFTRLFYNVFCIILFACTVYSCTEVVFRLYDKSEFRKTMIQFSAIIVPILIMCQLGLYAMNLFYGYDVWQNTTAMYFGSSIVRMCGFAYLLLPYIERLEFDWKIIVQVSCISFFLITRSTIALPMIIVAALGYFGCWLCLKTKRGTLKMAVMYAAILAAGLTLASLISKIDVYQIETEALAMFGNAQKILVVAAEIGIIFSILFRRKRIRWLDFMLILIGMLLIVPGFNGLAATASVFSFVLQRVITGYLYFLIIISVSYGLLFLFLKESWKRTSAVIGIGLSLAAVSLDVHAFRSYAGTVALILPETAPQSIRESIHALAQNPAFLQEEILETGSLIDSLAQSGTQPVVLSPVFVDGEGNMEMLSLLLKTEKSNSIILSSTIRWPEKSNPVYSEFSNLDQDAYHNFIFHPDWQTVADLKSIVERFGVNTLVLPYSEDYTELLNSIGFTQYGIADNGSQESAFMVFTSIAG